MRHGVVIVGSSVAGVRAARALRAEGYQGRVTLVGEERGLPCDRPPLSKQVLTGAWAPERAGLLTAQAAQADGIELRLGAPPWRSTPMSGACCSLTATRCPTTTS